MRQGGSSVTAPSPPLRFAPLVRPKPNPSPQAGRGEPRASLASSRGHAVPGAWHRPTEESTAPMPDLLLELFSEEIPARMQRRAAEDLKALVTDALVERGFVYEGAKAFATPRRLALHVVGPARRRAATCARSARARASARPRRPCRASSRAAGLSSLDRGDDRAAIRRRASSTSPSIERPGRPTPEVLAEIVPAIMRAFPWPKSMRWGAASASAGVAALGAPAALHRLHLRAGDRGAGDRALRGRRHRVRRRHARPPLHGAGADPRAALRRLRAGARKGQGRARRRPAQGHHPARRPRPRLRAGPRPGRGRGAAGGGRGPRRMAGGADGRVRGALPRHPAGGDPRDHPRQPEMLRAARSARDGAPRQPLHPRSPTSIAPRRRRGDRRRQRARHPRAPVRRRQFFWETRPARLPLEDAAAQKLERDIVFHEKLGTQGERVERIEALARRARAGRRRRSGAGRARRRGSPRPTSSPRWSASSRNCRA